MADPDLALKEAVAALRRNQFEQAEKLIRQALADRPNDSEALRLLGHVARAKGELSEAEDCLRRAIAIAPGSAIAHADLCSLLSQHQRAQEAIALLDRADATLNGPAWASSLKAATWMAERRPHNALPALEALVRQAPRAPLAWINLAEAAQSIGDLPRAVAAYRQTLALNPDFAPAWLGLAGLNIVDFEPEDVAAMTVALGRARGDLDRVQLGYALGKALGDQGEYEASFRHFEKANALRGALTGYDPETLDKFIAAMALAPAAPALAPSIPPKQGCGSPIFILGMPRSGSTLVEQILDCHSQIEGLGELFELRTTATRIANSLDGLPSAMANLTREELAGFVEHYLEGTARYRCTNRPYFTDKMPANWQLTPLIRRMLPHARIVDVRRDRTSCCLSGFMTYFNQKTQFPANFPDLMLYYDAYSDFMDRMQREYSAAIHLLHYEDLIADPEAEVRRLLDFLNLEFEPGCLRPHENSRAVFTPSAQQVRQPLGQGRQARWQNYVRWVQHPTGNSDS